LVDADSEYDAMWQETNAGYAFFFDTFFVGSCPEEASHLPCLGRDDYADLIFRQSDVHVAVLSTFPALTCEQAERIGYPVPSGICGEPFPNQAIADTRDIINEAVGSQRVIAHSAVVPNASSHLSAADKDRWVQETMRGMENAVNEAGIRAWKCYTPFGPLPNEVIKDLQQSQILTGLIDGSILAEGFRLDDEYGQAMIEQARNLGTPLINVHKGVPILSFNPEHGSASDIGRVATTYPDVTFVVYHSALNFNMASTDSVVEGPYNPEDWGPNDDPLGINSMIHSVVVNGLSAEGKGSDYVSNVVAELGGPGRRTVTNPDQGTHIIGKLLKYIGENNIVWGTDAIWGGSPQALMQAFFAFEMDEAVAEANGYPMLTAAIKAKILGLNAARIYGVDPNAVLGDLADDAFARARREYKDMMARAPVPLRPNQVYKGPRSRRDFFKLWAKSPNYPG
ncbi:MAG: amidohydrolase family protein, partial [Deltaproteobacteria bacterium]|nr:amidohydrolase family protein [Deltaproteobacteria bacterium]